MSTNIEDLIESNLNQTTNVSDEKLYESIFDFDIEQDLRLQYINRYNKLHHNDITDMINRMKSMYLLSKTKLIHNFLIEICKNSDIDYYLKVECCMSLCKNTDNIVNFETLDLLLDKSHDLFPICRKNAILLLIKCHKLKENALKHILNYINDQKIDILLRYELILDFNTNVDEKLDKYYTINSSNQFISSKNKISYKLLCCQNLLINYDIENRNDIEDLLLNYAKDNNLAHELRSDSADIILNYGSQENKNIARDIILQLGKLGVNTVKSVYDNAENIHFKEIEKTSIDIIEKIYKLDIKIKYSFENIFSEIFKNIDTEFSKMFLNQINYDFTKLSEIESLLHDIKSKYSEKHDLLLVSLNRIKLDRAIYSKFNLSLSKLLVLIYNYILENQYKDEMLKRLYEELIEMSGKCSSGYAFRLVNVLSGFGEFTVSISHYDRLKSMFIHNMNNYIKESDISDILLEELIKKPIERTHFKKFLNDTTQKILNELKDEFKDDLEDDDYIFYIRKISMEYEGY